MTKKRNNLNFIINKYTNSNIWYHGSNFPNLTINTIKINNNSPQMFYGNAFYVASDINLAKKYGKYIYIVQFQGNFYEVISREFLGTYGTFQDYLNEIYHSYLMNILDYIEEDPKYWSKILKLKKNELIKLYNDDDSDTLTKYFIQNNENELFEEYIENQISLREEFEDEGYDGILDATQCAIFHPQKCIKTLKLLI